MRVLFIHNDYARYSGEEAACEALARLLTVHGHEVAWYRRRSAELGNSLGGSVKAFFCGIHNPHAGHRVAELIAEHNPDVVFAQNLYPLISPAPLAACRKAGVPVVMRCPNYRLFCANGLHSTGGEVCERCLNGVRELHCILHNCTGSLAKSIGYALRNASTRVRKAIVPNVDMFIVQSAFQKRKFIEHGISAERIGIIPGLLPADGIVASLEPVLGRTVSFVGRISPEKGIEDVLRAAARLPDIPFAVAGDTHGMPGIEQMAPPNVTWHGFLTGDELARFYENSRVLVFPSRCFEGFPNVIARAMAMGKPVVVTRMGVLPEIIDNGVNGLLAEARSPESLAQCVRELYDDPDTCRAYGLAGRKKALTAYSPDVVYGSLMAIFEAAREACSARGIRT